MILIFKETSGSLVRLQSWTEFVYLQLTSGVWPPALPYKRQKPVSVLCCLVNVITFVHFKTLSDVQGLLYKLISDKEITELSKSHLIIGNN